MPPALALRCHARFLPSACSRGQRTFHAGAGPALRPYSTANARVQRNACVQAGGSISVAGATEEGVGSQQDALGLLTRGSFVRVTGQTLMNQTSSRSHAIFTVTVAVEHDAAAGASSAHRNTTVRSAAKKTRLGRSMQRALLTANHSKHGGLCRRGKST